MNSIRMKEVAARVVAWHNRHPLAQRVTLGQVDGIGVIALPFVTASERVGAAVRPDLVAPRVVVEPSFEPPVLDEPVSVIESAMAGQEGAATPPDGPAAEDSPRPRLRDRATAQAGDEPGATSPDTSASEASPSLPAWHPKAWAQTLRRWLWPGSRTGFQGVFSEDFIAPISPKQVSRWALAHGSTTWPGETHWPRREVAPDAALLSRVTGGSGVEPVTLYLVTAAIVTHKGRLRVLLGRDGRALGPRQFSLMRILLACALMLGLAAGGAWQVWGPGGAEKAPPEATAASAPAGAASVARSAASAVTPPQPTLLIAPDLAPRHAASAVASAPATGASSPQEPTPAPGTALIMDKSVPTTVAAAAPATPQASGPAAAKTVAPAPSAAGPATAARPRAPSLNEGKLAAMGGKLGISEADKQAALTESRRLRASEPKAKDAPLPVPVATPNKEGRAAKPATPAPEPPEQAATVAKPQAAELGLNAASARQSGATGPKGQRFYALVSKSSFTKVEADARMVQLRSAAANAIAPAGTRIEVIQARNAWQAVWWPFTKREDAERARGLLAARGMPVDIVEF